VPPRQPEIIPAQAARDYWRALLENAVSLVEDAALLLEQSPARAMSLLILAQEEIGKADALYCLAQGAWTAGRPTVELPASFLQMERLHHPKLIASLESSDDLAPFWGDYSALLPMAKISLEQVVEQLEAAAEQRGLTAKDINLRKQAGFYVDRRDGEVVSPQTTPTEPGTLVEEMVRTAAVAEMLLIRDHSRMKFETPERYDSTHDLQARLLPFCHPDLT
jgi:AbiV family abortive infection protein